jgi:ABC-type multidrug transport system fused ATPase/permease subunit
LGERGDTLSGGQKQRLAIARALLKDAPILILDEPTSALDTDTEHLLVTALQRVTRDRTVLIVTHRESTTVHADRVVRLDHGHIIEEAHR